MNRMVLAYQLYKVHKNCNRASSITATSRRVKVRTVDKKNVKSTKTYKIEKKLRTKPCKSVL